MEYNYPRVGCSLEGSRSVLRWSGCYWEHASCRLDECLDAALDAAVSGEETEDDASSASDSEMMEVRTKLFVPRKITLPLVLHSVRFPSAQANVRCLCFRAALCEKGHSPTIFVLQERSVNKALVRRLSLSGLSGAQLFPAQQKLRCILIFSVHAQHHGIVH